MTFALKKSIDLDEAHVWSVLPDVSEVSDHLEDADAALFAAIGHQLARAGQTARFAVTLLHSHFQVGSDELLVETTDRAGRIMTNVRRKADVRDLDLVPRSWTFDPKMQTGVANIRVVTWAEGKTPPHAPLSADDDALLNAIAAEFARHEGASAKFGMALIGTRPRARMVWSENTSVTDRLLVQEQVPVASIEWGKALRTIWIFDDQGRHTITMGCCRQLTAGQGHSGLRHKSGITA